MTAFDRGQERLIFRRVESRQSHISGFYRSVAWAQISTDFRQFRTFEPEA